MYDINLNNVLRTNMIKLDIKHSRHYLYNVNNPFILGDNDTIYFTPLRSSYATVIQLKYGFPF